MQSEKKERAATVAEEVYQVARAADVAADRTDGFAERADLNIHAAVAAQMIHGAATAIAEDAGGVRVVYHHDAIVFFGEIAERGERGDIAFHGKNTVGDEQLFAVPRFGFFQDALAIGYVLVLENFDGGFREAAAVNDGGVIQLVGNDQIVFAEQRGDGTCVGRKAGLKHDAGFRMFEARDLLFEIHVHFHRACNRANRAGADAEFSSGVNGGAAELGGRGESVIIVGAEVDYFLAVEDGDGFLLAFENF